MSEFFSMGGHAAYVWTAYGVAAAGLIGLLAATLRRLRADERRLRLLEQASPRRRREAAP